MGTFRKGCTELVGGARSCCRRMVHGQLLDTDREFLIKLSADSADSKAADGSAPAAAADTDAVRDCGSGKAAASAGCMDVALMTEEDTYRDFHSAFSVSVPAARGITCDHPACCCANPSPYSGVPGPTCSTGAGQK